MCNKSIIIRYNEIFLKGKNRGSFERSLIKNIKFNLKDFSFDFKKSSARFFVENYDEANESYIVENLKKIFGIYSVSVSEKVKTDFNEISNAIDKIIPIDGTFRLTVNRADKSFMSSSTEIAMKLGEYVLGKNNLLKVNLHNPQTVLFVDIRENGFAYVYSNILLGLGGMPVGSGGKGLLLLSGGIDSPVAGFRMAKRGMNLDAIHFHSFPYTSIQAKDKVIELAKKVSKYSGEMNVYVINFTDIQLTIHECCRPEYMITVMRRIMITIAEKIAKKVAALALITGESLGQVASQTIESLTSTNEQAKIYPILRPLIAFDKIEIIEEAKKINTYELSILPFDDCCTVFLPKNPLIKPNLEKVRKEELKILNLSDLIEIAVDSVEIIRL